MKDTGYAGSQKLQELLAAGLEDIERYLDDYQNGKLQLRLNWPVLFDKASDNAQRDINLSWATVALRSVEIWMGEETYWESYLDKCMSLRAALIAKLGACPGDAVLDREVVLHWFDDKLTLSLPETKKKIANWHETDKPLHERLTLDDLRELRYMRQRLAVIRKLADSGQLPGDSHLNDWLAVQAELP